MQRSSISGVHIVSLIVYCLHHLSLTCMHTPPPFLFPDASVRSLRNNEKPSSSSKASGTPSWHHVSVNTIKFASRYSKQLLWFARSSSILGVSDRALLRMIEGSGGLLVLRRRRSRRPPRLPLFRSRRAPVFVVRISAGR